MTAAGLAAAGPDPCSTLTPPTWAVQWCHFPQILVSWVAMGSTTLNLMGVAPLAGTTCRFPHYTHQHPPMTQMRVYTCSPTRIEAECTPRTRTILNLSQWVCRQKWTTQPRRMRHSRSAGIRLCSPVIRPYHSPRPLLLQI